MAKLNLKLMIVQTIIMGFTYAGLMALFGFIWGEKFNTWQFIFNATFFGIFMGILFPLITKIATNRALKKTIIELNEDEQFIFEGASTLKCKLFSAGGKLILTTKRLAFKPHKLNSKKTFVEIPLNEITKVEQHDTLGFINNILIIQKANEELKFYVDENERDVWVSKISNFLNK
jgi:hypothetical protein